MIDTTWAYITMGIGLAVFIILIIVGMLKTGFRLGELDNGEIRKAVMVAFTVIYIILLPYYFYYAYMPAAENISQINASMLVENIPTAQMQTFNASPSSLPEVPTAALNDLMRNFLWVYIVLIIFYFGSRTLDGYTEGKRIGELRQSEPEKILQTQYARGKIDNKTFDERSAELKK
jgi:hypothetical protein